MFKIKGRDHALPCAWALFPGYLLLFFLLFCSATSHFSDHLILKRSASRSHISVTSLSSGEVCCSNREASVFCHTRATEWMLTVLYSLCWAALSALRHLSSLYPHTAIWRHLSQLEAHLLFLQLLLLAQKHKLYLSLTWVCVFLIRTTKEKREAFPNSRLTLNAELVTTWKHAGGNITTYFKVLS